MHGLLAARRGWSASRRSPTGSRHPGVGRGGVPVPALAAGRASPDRARARDHDRGDGQAPVAFGWHPFLRLPGEPREDWRVEIGAATRLELDDRMLPTGRRFPRERGVERLGDRGYDEALADVDGPFVLEGARRRIEVRFLEGAPYAHFFAPTTEALVSFEPMAAPGNALVTGEALAAAPWRMRFSIGVTSVSGS